MRRRPARRVAYCVEALEVRFLLAAAMPLDAAPALAGATPPVTALTVPTLIVPGSAVPNGTADSSTAGNPADLMLTGSGDGGALSLPQDATGSQDVTGSQDI